MKYKPKESDVAAGGKLPPEVALRSIFDTRLVIRNAPSGTRYDFQPGEVKPIRAEDKKFLLGLEHKPAGCCGGAGQARRYFEEAQWH